MIFEHPLFLLIIPILIISSIWFMKNRTEKTIILPNTSQLKKLETPRDKILIKLPFYLRVLTIIIGIFILSQPQLVNSKHQASKQGINIMLVIDLSKSMTQQDLKPSRLEAAKKTIRQFIKQRQNDQIGLVVFGRDAYTSCPLTTDRSLLDTFVSRFTIGTVNPFGTAIGLSIATALNRFNNSKQSNVIILLTDGMNNAGNIDPLTATELANKKHTKIYTIGVGTNQEYNSELLKLIASKTDGKFYEAQNTSSLEAIYNEINKLERHKFKQTHRFNTFNLYPTLISICLFLVFIELFIREIILSRISQ